MEKGLLFDVYGMDTEDGFSITVSLCDYPQSDGLTFDALVYMVPATSALNQYNTRQDQAALHCAIYCWEHLIPLAPHSHSQKYGWYRTLASLYMRRHTTNNDAADIDKAVSFYRTSVDMAPPFYVDRADHLYDSGLAYLMRYSSPYGNHADADDAEIFFKRAIGSYLGSEPPQAWQDLSSALLYRYEFSGSLEDLDQSISARRIAVNKCTDVLQRRNFQARLCHLLAVRFRHEGNQEDAAELDKVALEAAGETQEDILKVLSIAATLRERFRHSGRPAELDEAVLILTKLLESTVDPSRCSFRWIVQVALSQALHERFSRFRDPQDQIYSHSALREVMEGDFPVQRLISEADLLSNLGLGHFARFQLSKNPSDLDDAIEVTRQAINSTPKGHWPRHSRWGDLGSLLVDRYSAFGRIDDLDEAHSCFRRALRHLPDDHRDKSKLLRYLGRLHMLRYNVSNQAEDIEVAVDALKSAMESTPKDYPERVLRLWDLGCSLQMRSEISNNFFSDMDQAVSAFKEAALSKKGSFYFRIHAAWLWGECASLRWREQASKGYPTDVDDAGQVVLHLDGYRNRLNGYREPFRAFSRMMDLIPLAIWMGDTIPVRHGMLKHKMSGRIRIAAETMCMQYGPGSLAIAVEWLEQGRSVVWRQQLNLRARLDELQGVEPDLAQKMRDVSMSLDSASTHNGADPRSEEPRLDEFGPPRRQHAEKWESLLLEARQVPGFERLLEPKQVSELRKAACIGPVVMLNMGHTCYALVLLKDRTDILHVALSLPIAQVEELRTDLTELLKTSNVRSRLYRKEANRHRTGSQEMQRILLTLWIDVVKPVLDALGFPVLGSSELHPRIVWCPTGSLAFLPIHAAGDYSSEEPGHRISDFVVSSYTSTISTLLDALNRHISSELRCLTVSQSESPGLSGLPCTEMEVCKVKQHIGPAKVKELNGEAATVVAVHDAMERCSWIHLACHAIQDPIDPLKSAFCLADGRLELQDIIQKSHPHADFAFLSACQTSTGDEKLADEAVHLAAGMQLAGYRSIIATMWSMNDEDGPLVADQVYAHLLQDGHPDSSHAAHALHHAVLKLQGTTKPEDRDDGWFLRWVPFIHIGA